MWSPHPYPRKALIQFHSNRLKKQRKIWANLMLSFRNPWRRGERGEVKVRSIRSDRGRRYAKWRLTLKEYVGEAQVGEETQKLAIAIVTSKYSPVQKEKREGGLVFLTRTWRKMRWVRVRLSDQDGSLWFGELRHVSSLIASPIPPVSSSQVPAQLIYSEIYE